MKRLSMFPKILAAGGVLCLTASVAMADSISPSSFAATLTEGASTTITKTVTVSAGAPTTSNVDVFFLADTTGSMYYEIAAVRAGAAAIMSGSAALGSAGAIQWGVGEYKDFDGDPYAYRLNQSITANQTAVQTGINAWDAYGGADWEEAELYALTRIANDAATGWRSGSEKLVVWFGDAPGHDPSGGATLASTTAALNAQGISVLAIDVGSMNAYGQASYLATNTGGQYFSGINSGSIVSTISAAITTAVETYTQVGLELPSGLSGVTVTSSPPFIGTYDRSVERTFAFDVTFTGDAVGTYDFAIYGTVDGGRVAKETDLIVVTAAGVPDGGSSVLLIGLGLAVMGAARRKFSS